MARANDPDPDPARARLAGLGARAGGSVPGRRVGAWSDPPAGERVGWPGAAPGTPAARLRLPAPGTSPGAPPPGSGWLPQSGALDPVPRRPPTADEGSWGERGSGGTRAWDGCAWDGGSWDGGSWDDAWADEDAGPAHERSATADGRYDDPDVAHDGWARQATERWGERWLPVSWRGARWDPGRAGAVALAAIAAIAAVVAAIGVWSGRPSAEPVPPLPSVTGPGPASPSAATAPAAAGPIVVSVSGKVARPGLVRLSEGARVGEAVTAAGGATPGVDLSGLNLAQRLTDGEQVAVGVPPPAPSLAPAVPGAPAGARSRSPAPAAAGDKVDLNTATLEQLDGLPGVGPVTAQKILDWRTQNGRFASVDQLQEVGGIGPARLNTLRARVTV